jgi:hypothetical protein
LLTVKGDNGEMSVLASFPMGPDPAVVIVGMALACWLARLAWSHMSARRWQWTIADWLWFTVIVGLAITYLSIL